MRGALTARKNSARSSSSPPTSSSADAAPRATSAAGARRRRQRRAPRRAAPARRRRCRARSARPCIARARRRSSSGRALAASPSCRSRRCRRIDSSHGELDAVATPAARRSDRAGADAATSAPSAPSASSDRDERRREPEHAPRCTKNLNAGARRAPPARGACRVIDHHRADDADARRAPRRSSRSAADAAPCERRAGAERATTTAAAYARREPREHAEREDLAAEPRRAQPEDGAERISGRPRWNTLRAERQQPDARARRIDVDAAATRERAVEPIGRARSTTNAPTESCVSTSITTSGRCGCAARTRVEVRRQEVARQRALGDV